MLREKIEASISKFHMQPIYEGAILGFSGGADSSALLYLLKDKVKNLLCVHVNHMIRGDEADRDEKFARRICKEYGVEFKSFKIDIPTLAKENKKGIEEMARDARYELFSRLLFENPQYKCILTAHNLDDSVETVIFNLSRGTGPSGLMGIKPVQGNIMRPLIEIKKGEIINFCKENNIEYITDSTNNDTKYMRNHIRHNVIPTLEKINPDLYGAISRLGDILYSDEAHFSLLLSEIIEKNEIKDKIPLNVLNSLDVSLATRLLRHVLDASLDYNSCVYCIDLAKKGTVGSLVNLPNGISFKIEKGYAHFIKTSELDSVEYSYQLKEGINEIPEINKLILVNSRNVPRGYTMESEIKLKAEKITGQLNVRKRAEGDTIKHGKMTKKVKKLFVDNHIPSHLRDRIPLILMDNEIISVPNIATRDGFSGNDFIIIIYRRENEND